MVFEPLDSIATRTVILYEANGMNRNRLQLRWVILAAALIALVTGTYFLSVAGTVPNLRGSYNRQMLGEQTYGGFTLLLTLDKASYSGNDYANVTLTLRNNANHDQILSNFDESAVELLVYDANKQYIGSWSSVDKAPVMRPSIPTTITLGPSQTYSWSLTWNFSVRAPDSSIEHRLPAGTFYAQAQIPLSPPGSNLMRPEPYDTLAMVSNFTEFSLST
jgi:hypothetical protein